MDEKNKNPWPWWTMKIIYLSVGLDGLLLVDATSGGMHPQSTVVLVVVVLEGGRGYYVSVGRGADVNKIPRPWRRRKNWLLAP